MPHPGLPACLFAFSVCGALLQDGAASDLPPVPVAQAISNLRDAATVYDEPAMKAAVAQLARIGRPALSQVEQLLHHDDANVRWKAVQTLGAIGIADPRLCPELLAGSGDADADVRGAAIDVLAQLYPRRPQTHHATQRLLADPHPLVRVRAAAALWTTRHDVQAINTLAGALQHPDWMAAQEASRRLATVGYPAIPVLLKLLDAPQPRIQRGALLTLGKFTQLPRAALPKVCSLADSDDPLLFPAAMRALLACGQAGRKELQTRCAAAAVSHRTAALQTLATTAASDPVFQQLLVQILADPAPACQLAALAAIAQHRVTAPELRQPLWQFLHHPSADHRAAAIAALAALGAAARPALPRLRQLADQEHVDYIRRAAHELARRLDTGTTHQDDYHDD